MHTKKKDESQFEIIFYDNTDLNHDLLPQTKIALFGKKVSKLAGNLDPRKYQAYISPYLILSGMILKDIMAGKKIKVLINSFYNYLKPTHYDLLILEKTRIIHSFSSVEEFFYDILFPNDKAKTRPLEKTPLKDPSFLSDTLSNTQFIKRNPAKDDSGIAEKLKTNLDVGIQIFHFEKVYTIYDKLNNIIISEEKAIEAIKEDPELKKYILKVDLKKYCLSYMEEISFHKSKIYSIRGHYLIGRTFYNSPDKDKATYLIVEKPAVVNTLELCTNNKIINMMVKNFITDKPKMDGREIINLVYPNIQGRHIMKFLEIGPNLKIPFLNKDYVLVDKECIVGDEKSTAKMITPRKFIANMYEAKYFHEIMKKS